MAIIKSDFISGSNVDLYNLSYRSIYTLRNDFVKAGGRYGNDFNATETPLTAFFRPFFYFSNRVMEYNDDGGNQHSGPASGNLLSLADSTQGAGYTFANSAYNYLKINNELERADYIKRFIELLSNISTYSPWYFTKVTGMGEAMAHKELTPKEFKIEDERQKIVFECLPDAYDTRIGTLLDLYKDACFSFTLNKEVVPANLRKFDMGIYVFSAPINNMHKYDSVDEGLLQKDSWADFGNYDGAVRNTSKYMTSSKYIEFTNCEIDIGSCGTGMEALDNAVGIELPYKITIAFDRCYETRYNEFMGQIVSDIIKYDFSRERTSELETVPQRRSDALVGAAQTRLDAYSSSINNNAVELEDSARDKLNKYNKSIVEKALGQLGKNVTTAVDEMVKRVSLGNLYDVTSLSKIGDVGRDLSNGNILGAANSIKGMVENGNGISIGGIGVRTSSGWLRKNIEDGENTSNPSKKSSKNYSLDVRQYINMGIGAANNAIERAVSGGTGEGVDTSVSNDQTQPGWKKSVIEGMRTKITKKK